MKYKMEPALSRITSPITLIFPNGSEMQLVNGRELVEAKFDKKWFVFELSAKESVVEIKVKEQINPCITWIGEEQSFF